jgi:hypothetical protein
MIPPEESGHDPLRLGRMGSGGKLEGGLQVKEGKQTAPLRLAAETRPLSVAYEVS